MSSRRQILLILTGMVLMIDASSKSIHGLLTPPTIPEAQERMILPPRFPDKPPYGWFSSALLCKFFVGPLAPFSMNRACAGPVPPFKKTNSTTTTPSPKAMESGDTKKSGYYYYEDDDDSSEEQSDDEDYYEEWHYRHFTRDPVIITKGGYDY